MRLVRLQKYLAEAGVCSRRKGETHIRAGRVRINGRVVTELGTKVDAGVDRVEFDGHCVRPVEKKIYIALNKPAGYVTSCSQPGRDLVVDLIDLPERLFPVGRLDAESCGLLLMTSASPGTQPAENSRQQEPGPAAVDSGRAGVE